MDVFFASDKEKTAERCRRIGRGFRRRQGGKDTTGGKVRKTCNRLNGHEKLTVPAPRRFLLLAENHDRRSDDSI
jgi:hypothetical protein